MTAQRTSAHPNSWRRSASTVFLALVGASIAATIMYMAVSALAGSTNGSIAAAIVYAVVLTTTCMRGFPRGRRLATVLALLSITVSVLIVAFYVMMLIFMSGYT